jgi:hypothetical protein
MNNGWIGFDLDGTLAKYTTWNGPTVIGEPIKPMVDLLQAYIAQGVKVKIFTARVASSNEDKDIARKAIEKWCIVNIGYIIPVTAEKDFGMIALYDDRCIHVQLNTGGILG